MQATAEPGVARHGRSRVLLRLVEPARCEGQHRQQPVDDPVGAGGDAVDGDRAGVRREVGVQDVAVLRLVSALDQARRVTQARDLLGVVAQAVEQLAEPRQRGTADVVRLSGEQRHVGGAVGGELGQDAEHSEHHGQVLGEPALLPRRPHLLHARQSLGVAAPDAAADLASLRGRGLQRRHVSAQLSAEPAPERDVPGVQRLPQSLGESGEPVHVGERPGGVAHLEPGDHAVAEAEQHRRRVAALGELDDLVASASRVATCAGPATASQCAARRARWRARRRPDAPWRPPPSRAPDARRPRRGTTPRRSAARGGRRA